MPSVVDLDPPITAWAKTHLEITDEELTSGIVKLEIDASKIRQSTKDLEYSPKTADGESSSATDPSTKTKQSKKDIQNAPKTGQEVLSKVTFTSSYENNTKAPQEHVFIMERFTEATVSTSLKKGFMRNGTVGIKVDVPETVREAIGDFGSQVTVTSEEENIVNHSLKWAIKSKVNVPKETKAVGKLIISERKSDFGFSATVILKGSILAKAVNTKTGRAWQTKGNIANILGEEKFNGGFKPGSDVTIDLVGTKVEWKVEGKLNFRFGISSDFKVDHTSCTTK